MKLGIIGAGKIAQEVLTFINTIENIETVAIAATLRSEEKLKKLSAKYEISKYYTDYEDLLKNPEVEVVYVALPNNLHYEVMDKGLDYGKDIICEKPFTANINQALKIFKKAESKDRIILEAMSNRFIPNAIKVKEEIGKLGKIKIVSFNYSQYSSRYDRFRQGDIAPAFSLENAGGTLMDLNIYNIDYAINLFGRPKDVRYFPNIEEIPDALNSFGSYRMMEIGGEYTNYNINEDKSRLYYEFVEFEKIIRNRDMERVSKLKELTLITTETINQARIEAGIFFPVDSE